MSGEEIIKNVKYLEEEISTSMREEYKEEDENRLDNSVFMELFEEGNYVRLNNNKIISDGRETVPLIFRGFGKEGVTYRTTFYLNHQPIGIQGHDYLEWKTIKGSIAEFKIDFDISQMEGNNTLYSISAAIDGNFDVYDPIQKTDSMLLLIGNAPSSQPSDSQIYDVPFVVEAKPTGINPFLRINNNNIEDYVLYKAGEGKVLIRSDKLYLFDVQDQEVIAQAPLMDFDIPEDYYATEDGYCVVGIDRAENQRKTKACFYNKNLEIEQEYNLNEVLGESPRYIAVAGADRKIVYETKNGLFLYDLAEGTKETLLEYGLENVQSNKGLDAVREIAFFDKDTKLAFIGTSLDKKSKGGGNQKTFGIISTDGSGIINEQAELPRLENMEVSDEYVAFSESSYPYGAGEPAGKVILMDPKGQILRHTLKEKREGSNVFLSDKGKHFMTALPSESGEILFRLYDSQTGKLIREFKQPADKTKGNYMKTYIEIFDDANTFLAVSTYYKSEPVVTIQKF